MYTALPISKKFSMVYTTHNVEASRYRRLLSIVHKFRMIHQENISNTDSSYIEESTSKLTLSHI